MKPDNACYGCEKRTPGCHGSCQEYAAFRKESQNDFKQRQASEDYGVYAGYARQKKTKSLANAARKGYRLPNHKITRYH